MATHSFIETEDLKFSAQLTKFAKALVGLFKTLGLSKADSDSATADALFMAYILTWLSENRSFAITSTTYKDLARHGDGTAIIGDIPLAPIPDIAPDSVDSNIQGRFSDMAGRIKKAPNYTTAIGDTLGINAPAAAFVPGDGKPSLSIKPVEGGFPQIKFTMGDYEGIQLQKDSGAGFAMLNVVLHPSYVDKSGMPAPGTSIIVKYRAIYLYKGVPVGEMSDVVAITVTG